MTEHVSGGDELWRRVAISLVFTINILVGLGLPGLRWSADVAAVTLPVCFFVFSVPVWRRRWLLRRRRLALSVPGERWRTRSRRLPRARVVRT